MATKMQASQDSSVYQPVAPFSATWTSTLSQDAVMTDTIPVDSTSPSPAAPFTNPNAGGRMAFPAVETLVVTGGALGHVARDFSTDAGWSLTMLDGLSAREAAAGTAYAGLTQAAVYGLFQDTSALYSIQLQPDGAAWSPPAVVSAASHSYLRSAYSPDGALVVYAQDDSGNLVIAHQPSIGAAFVTQAYTLPTPLSDGDYFLCLTDETNWTLAANVGSQLWIYDGVLDGSSTTPSSSGQAANYTGTINQVVLGYWSTAQDALMFLFVDSTNALQVWASAGGTVFTPPPNPTGTVSLAAAHVYVDPETGLDSVHVYTLDNDQNLAVLHQNSSAPWNEDGSPNWAAYLPLSGSVAGVAIDSSPADTPTLFALSAADYSLRLHRQDPATRMWITGQVLQSGSSTFEATRFRAEVNIIDGAGRVLPNYPVSVSVGANYSGVDLWAGGVTYPITSTVGADLTTDAMGKLTLAVLTQAGLAAPEIIVSADMLPTPLTVALSGATHTYLSGAGVLNPTNPLNPAAGAGPLPVFDAGGVTLTAATVNGVALASGASGNAALAQVAASAIQQTAMVGLGATPPGVAGYKVSFNDLNQPTFQIIPTSEDLEIHLRAMKEGLAGDGWSDIGDFFSDLWEGMKNAAISIKDFIVSAADKVATFTLQIGNEIKSGIQLALQGLEQAGHFIAGVFNVLKADIDDLIDWLKALFDFGAIWRTKMALEASLLAVPQYISDIAALATTAVDGWFAKQETLVDQVFTQAIAQYQGQTFGQLSNFQPSGQPLGTTPAAGGAAPADFGNNVHHNWLQDKAFAYGSGDLGIQDQSAVVSPWESFTTHIDGSKDDFLAGVKDFASAVQTSIQDPNAFGTVAIPEFLAAVQNMIKAALGFMDAIVDGMLALVEVVMEALTTILTTPIEIGFLQDLWSWVAAQAGYPADNTLNAVALISLLGAVPTTVIYKLVAGVENEPFPASQSDLLAASDGVAAVTFSGTPQTRLAAGILQVCYFVPAMVADTLNETSPTLLSLLMIGWSATTWILMNQITLTTIDWAVPAVVVAVLIGLAPAVYTIVKTVVVAIQAWIAANLVLFNDIVNGVVTAYGLAILGFHMYQDFTNAPDDEMVVAGLLIPLASLFSFANLSYFRDDPEVAPFALAVKIAFDLIGYGGGGLAEVIDANNALNAGGAQTKTLRFAKAPLPVGASPLPAGA